LTDAHTIGERRDVEHVKQGSLGGSDLATSLNELQIGRDFNGTTSNLGWDTESLEERGLSGFHTSITSGDEDIAWGNGTSTSGRSNLVGENLLTDILEVGIGEDKTDVALDVRKQAFVLGGLRNEAFDGTANLWTRISYEMA
jgi:hypothetical protein